MSTRGWLMFSYRQLVRLYPAGFKQRFGEEMLELAYTCKSGEWVLFFADTATGIARAWLTDNGVPRPTETSGTTYVHLAEFPLKPLRLFEGLVMAALLTLAASYLSTQTVWNLPSCHTDQSCPPTVNEQPH